MKRTIFMLLLVASSIKFIYIIDDAPELLYTEDLYEHDADTDAAKLWGPAPVQLGASVNTPIKLTPGILYFFTDNYLTQEIGNGVKRYAHKPCHMQKHLLTSVQSRNAFFKCTKHSIESEKLIRNSIQCVHHIAFKKVQRAYYRSDLAVLDEHPLCKNMISFHAMFSPENHIVTNSSYWGYAVCINLQAKIEILRYESIDGHVWKFLKQEEFKIYDKEFRFFIFDLGNLSSHDSYRVFAYNEQNSLATFLTAVIDKKGNWRETQHSINVLGFEWNGNLEIKYVEQFPDAPGNYLLILFQFFPSTNCTEFVVAYAKEGMHLQFIKLFSIPLLQILKSNENDYPGACRAISHAVETSLEVSQDNRFYDLHILLYSPFSFTISTFSVRRHGFVSLYSDDHYNDLYVSRVKTKILSLNVMLEQLIISFTTSPFGWISAEIWKSDDKELLHSTGSLVGNEINYCLWNPISTEKENISFFIVFTLVDSHLYAVYTCPKLGCIMQ